jgi:hydrogen cyanide synthase HcnC
MSGHIVASSETDVAVVGGGLVGASLAWGLARTGARVTVLDESDVAWRASRGNFALVWVQGKGVGMPEYATWSRGSADAWVTLAAELREETGIDVSFERPGGFELFLSERTLQRESDAMRRLQSQPGLLPQPYEVLDNARTKAMLPALGPKVVGSIYSPLDGHANSLRLFHALHVALMRRGAQYRAGCVVEAVRPTDGGFLITWRGGSLRAGKVVLAAGLGNARLAPMVGLDAPVRPNKGQIIVTERAAPFLRFPVLTVRQTDEGSVLLGDSQQEKGFDTTVEPSVLAVMAARAALMFPLIGRLRVVRAWSALRVMTPDGFPIYEQSGSCKGAFVATCHSGVTLAAAHAYQLAPAIARGALPPELETFRARRLRVPAAA